MNKSAKGLTPGAPQKKSTSLGNWMILESVLIVIASVCSFGLVEYFYNMVWMHSTSYDPILSVGMIGPMVLVMGTISYFFSKRTNRFINILSQGISRVADGDFQVRLDVSKAGPLKDVFADFNKMGAELQKVQTLRDDFINSFSHEFKTPITSINGFAQLLAQEDLPEDERRQYLGIIARESSRLAELANSTLLLSRLESQEIIMGKEEYSLDELLKQCAILLSPSWSKKSIDLTVELEPLTCRGNPELMQQVWINLLGNAIKFTPPGGRVFLGLKRVDQTAVVTVSDNGRGMGEEEQARIFLKYYQGDPSGLTKGLGLGLSIVKRILELCDGRIEVQSQLGQGSTFTVYLPAGINSQT